MKNSKGQSFKIIRKNGKRYMTHVSKKDLFTRLHETVREWLSVLKTLSRRIQALWTGNSEQDYVALSSGTLHGGMRIGRRP